MTRHILVIDQGTTSSRAVLFNEDGRLLDIAQKEFPQYFPKPGWVEHDLDEIWVTSLEAAQAVLKKNKITAPSILGIGITNQRETIAVWDKRTGRPLYKAIVWQDRRTASFCDTLKAQGLEKKIQEKTGLLVDPYFSASKMKWLLEQENVRAIPREFLAFGTIDSFLMHQLSQHKIYQTDSTNASRTQLFNIGQDTWDKDLLDIFEIDVSMLPEVSPSAHHFGVTNAEFFGGEIPILGVAGDQQAALIGQACFDVGDVKATFGTGCFALLNIGKEKRLSQHQLLTTIAYQIGDVKTYALEGSVFMAGAIVQWLRDGLGIINRASDLESLVESVEDSQGVTMVPAFTGLGAPYWDANARGMLMGLTRDSTRAHIARAALESVAFQTQDLLLTMQRDAGQEGHLLRVDGGMCKNAWLMQYLADLTGRTIKVAAETESTAQGACNLVRLQLGLTTMDALKADWKSQRIFEPNSTQTTVNAYKIWQRAVALCQSWRKE